MIAVHETVSNVDVACWWLPFATGAVVAAVASLTAAVAFRAQLGPWLDRVAGWAHRVVEGQPLPVSQRGPLPRDPRSHLRLVVPPYDQERDR